MEATGEHFEKNRVVETSTYEEYIDKWDSRRLASCFKQEKRPGKYKGKKYLQSYKNFIVNSLFEAAIQMSLHCKALDGTATFMLPIFVIGKYNGGKWLPALLAQYFSVFVVDEFYSSRRCPQCHEFVEQGKKWKLRTCNKGCVEPEGVNGLRFDRDVMSSRNMFLIFINHVCFGCRPPQMQRK